MKLNIEPDFESLLPPLTDEEFAQLKENMQANPDGFPPIIVWANNKNVIIDGHNQYRARVALGLPIKVKKMDFETRQEALSFAVKCQLGRRNLSASDRAKAVAHLVTTKHGGAERFSQAAKLPLGEKPDENSKNARQKKVSGDSEKNGLNHRQAAKAAGVSERTVRDAVKSRETGSNGAVSQTAKQVREDFNPPPIDETPEERMAEWNRKVEAFARSITALASHAPEGGWWDESQANITGQQLKSAAGSARQAKCDNLCPLCKGEGCKRCKKTGFMPKRTYEMAGGK